MSVRVRERVRMSVHVCERERGWRALWVCGCAIVPFGYSKACRQFASVCASVRMFTCHPD